MVIHAWKQRPVIDVKFSHISNKQKDIVHWVITLHTHAIICLMNRDLWCMLLLYFNTVIMYRIWNSKHMEGWIYLI